MNKRHLNWLGSCWRNWASYRDIELSQSIERCRTVYLVAPHTHVLLFCLPCSCPQPHCAAPRPLPVLWGTLPTGQLCLCPSVPAARTWDSNDVGNLVLTQQTRRMLVWLAKVQQRGCVHLVKSQGGFWCDLRGCVDFEQRLILNVSERNLALSHGRKYFYNSWIFLSSVCESSEMRISKLMLLYYLMCDSL